MTEASAALLLSIPAVRQECELSAAFPTSNQDAAIGRAYCGAEGIAGALALIEGGLVDAALLRAGRFAFPRVAEAYAAIASGVLVKAIVTFDA